MAKNGWEALLDGFPWFRSEGRFFMDAYSEFIPPPRFSPKPYDETAGMPIPGDLYGWPVSEYEEAGEIEGGLRHIGRRLVEVLENLQQGRHDQGIGKIHLQGNPFWPDELAEAVKKRPDPRRLVLSSLALSRTQDDKGRVRWTLFGGSEQGPGRAFWKSFFLDPQREIAAPVARDLLHGLLKEVYAGESGSGPPALDEFRIMPDHSGLYREDPLPKCLAPFVLGEAEPIDQVKYLLTFRPFSHLPEPVRKAYCEGRLNLLPFPGSLVFWGFKGFRELAGELPLARQIPLLLTFDRNETLHSIRIPQSGWLEEPKPNQPLAAVQAHQTRNLYRRTNRWARVDRGEDESPEVNLEDRMAKVLFSIAPESLGLYGKPMARNVQIWTRDFRLLLNGPLAGRKELLRVQKEIDQGGDFGYRMQFPAMRVGTHEIYWHRPLVAFQPPSSKGPEVVFLPFHGYLTGYPAHAPDPDRPVELWPRMRKSADHLVVARKFSAHERKSALNCRKLFTVFEMTGRKPLRPGFARSLLTVGKEESLDEWLSRVSALPDPGPDSETMLKNLRAAVAPAMKEKPLDERASLTYHLTSGRAFETSFWNIIKFLSEGPFRNKDNADCAQDPVTRSVLSGQERHLDSLGDSLLKFYSDLVQGYGLGDKVCIGEVPFAWETSFEYPWMRGGKKGREGMGRERNLLCIIPGRDRSRAVVMGDHYDTAYMEDVFDKQRGGSGARLAAAGADDNHSATAALMLAAPVFLELSRQGLLEHDVWLVHLTGEEFPADCLGSRKLAQSLVEGCFKIKNVQGHEADFSKTLVEGAFVLDMIAHNRDGALYTFQISPGTGSRSVELALHSWKATHAWNEGAKSWNQSEERKGRSPGRRLRDGEDIPPTALVPKLWGEVRLPMDPRSSLYNTDGQIFSDVGIPTILLMENYDINRKGYHDTNDTMKEIDLDFGAALAAISIEAVARIACLGRTGKPFPVDYKPLGSIAWEGLAKRLEKTVGS